MHSAIPSFIIASFIFHTLPSVHSLLPKLAAFIVDTLQVPPRCIVPVLLVVISPVVHVPVRYRCVCSILLLAIVGVGSLLPKWVPLDPDGRKKVLAGVVDLVLR